MAELRMEFNSSGAVLAIATQVLDGQIAGQVRQRLERIWSSADVRLAALQP